MTLQAIVTDIEGTTSSLSFVKEVLFPYARERLPEFVAQHAADPVVQPLLSASAELAGIAPDPGLVVAQLQRWMDEDRKAAPLKALQGLIWEHGYAVGDFTGHVYEDAVRNLRQWQAAGLRLYVYSSGSVLAQKLLFAHTAYGDLTPLFSGYFDTQVGAKQAAASYRMITDAIRLPARDILFLSDVAAELDAAHEAGMQVVQLLRDAAVVRGNHAAVTDFDGIDPRHLRQ